MLYLIPLVANLHRERKVKVSKETQIIEAWKEAQATRTTIALLLRELVTKIEKLNVEMTYLNDRLLNAR